VIWPGGSVIKQIIEDLWGKENISIDFEDDGTVYIWAKDQIVWDKARAIIQDILREPTKWFQTEGKITRTEAYGVFVEIKWGNVWLVHVKNLWQGFIEDASALHKVGETMKVEVMWMDKGKLQLKKAE
jgi:polyribonucleotide nucleotidyltransferase